MHCIIGVIHQKDLNVEDFCCKFLYDNTDYIEIEEEIPFSELREIIEKTVTDMEASYNLKDDKNKWIRELVVTLKKGTDKDKIDAYADWYGYQVDPDNNRLIRQSNPYGECDWFVTGGRWSGELKDFDGYGHDSLRVQDMNLDNPENLPSGLYGVIRYYKDEEWVDYDEAGYDAFRKEIEDATNWSETHEEEIYITLVDMHQ